MRREGGLLRDRCSLRPPKRLRGRLGGGDPQESAMQQPCTTTTLGPRPRASLGRRVVYGPRGCVQPPLPRGRFASDRLPKAPHARRRFACSTVALRAGAPGPLDPALGARPARPSAQGARSTICAWRALLWPGERQARRRLASKTLGGLLWRGRRPPVCVHDHYTLHWWLVWSLPFPSSFLPPLPPSLSRAAPCLVISRSLSLKKLLGPTLR